MKLYNSNKGFTLIELLAVIVVLAIVMLIAAGGILPYIESSRTGAFVTTSKNVVEAAKSAVLSGSITGETKSCYTIDELIQGEYLTRVTEGIYEGIVEVNSNNEYKIQIRDKNNPELVIIIEDYGSSVIEEDDIEEPGDYTIATTCP